VAQALNRLLASCVVFTAACAGAGMVMLAPVGYRGTLYIAAHVVATMAMLAAYRFGEARGVSLLTMTGVACRLLLVPVAPYTTHDVTRYMFDGAMALAGFDPYTVAPGDLRLVELHALWPSALEHAHYPTLYPPLALWAFASCARFGPGLAWLAWKAMVALASVVALLTARDVMTPKGYALLALSPLLVLEGGIGGHLDVLCVMAVMLALSETELLARGAWLGVGVLLKLTPVTLLVPFLVTALQAPRRAWRLLVGALSVIAVGYGVASVMGYQAVGSLQAFFAGWSFGSPWMLLEVPLGIPRSIVLRVGIMVAASAMVASVWLAHKKKLGPALLLAACAPYLASPVVFPWYACTAAALLGFAPSLVAAAWMATLPLTYEVIDRFDIDGSWQPALWPIVVMVLAVGLAVLLQRLVARRTR
jgi:alpha-1,6-mannosyltransferase